MSVSVIFCAVFISLDIALLVIALLYVLGLWNKQLDAKTQTGYLVLSDDNEVLDDTHCRYRVLINSRLTWCGCWLLLEAIEPPRSAYFAQSQFYFKDQFSEQDYARLSRFIIRQKNTAKTTTA